MKEIILPNEEEQETYILAEEFIKINFFIISYIDFLFVGTYRNKEQMIESLQKDKSKNKVYWPNVYEVSRTEVQETLDEFGKIYCPELRAEYTSICELLRDLKVSYLAGLLE